MHQEYYFDYYKMDFLSMKKYRKDKKEKNLFLFNDNKRIIIL